MHRRAASIIHKIPKQIPKGLLLDDCTACLTHQAYYKKHPDVINGLVVKHSLDRILRDNLRIEVPQSKTNVGRCSFRHRAAIIWNSLPEVVKAHENYEALRRI